MQQTIDRMSKMRMHQMAQIHHQRVNENMHQDYTPEEYTSMIIDQEWEDRLSKKTNRLLAAAKFKSQTYLSDIDLKTNRSLDKDMMNKLGLLNFIKNRKNVILTGPAGIGKSYIAQALGHQACVEGYKTLYQNTSRFMAMLKFAKMDGTYLKHLKKLNNTQLLIMDDFGLSKMDNKEREVLMDIIEDRHASKSTIIASQIPISKWYEVIGEGTIADAILDRIINSSYRIELKGKSLRAKVDVDIIN